MFVNNPTRSGEDTLFTFEGPPGATVFVAFSLQTGVRFRALFQGVDLLGSQRSVVSPGRLGADGRLQASLFLGPLPPGFDTVRIFSQPFYLSQFAATGTSKLRSSAGPLGGAPSDVSLHLGSGAMIVRLAPTF